MAGVRGRPPRVPKKTQQNTSQPQLPRPTRASPPNTGAGGKKILSSPATSAKTSLGSAHPNPNMTGSVFPKRGKGK